MNSPTRVVLLSKDEKSYGVVKNLITAIENNLFDLEWIGPEQTELKKVISQNYQIYLIDDHLWIAANLEQAQQLTTLEKNLSPLMSQVSPTPIILLTDNPSLGRAALKLGMGDYWDKNQLTVSGVERSLRLTLKNASSISNPEKALEEKKIKQQEAELQNWKNRYEAAIKASGQIFYEWNSQTDEVIWKGNLEKVLGYSYDEIVNNLDGWTQLIHPEDRLKFAVAIERMRETREADELVYRVRRKDGNYILVENRGEFWVDSQGKRVRMVGFVKDLTEKQKAKETIKQQEQEFKALVDNIPDLIIRLDRNNRCLYVNRIVEQLTRLTTSKILGKTPQEIGLPDSVVNLWTQTYQQVFQTGEERMIEYEYPSPEGKTYWQNRVVPELNREGKIETILVIGRNITKRKQAEETLAKNEEQLRLLMDSLPVCIAYTDAEQRYQFINKNYEHWFGHKKEEIFGKTLQEVLGQKAYQVVRHNVERALKGEPVTYETTLPYQNGGTRHVLGNLIPDLGENSQIKGYYALITDISERKRAEEKLHDRLVLETAITLVSKELASYEQVDFKRILQILGVAVKVNRVYLLRFEHNATKASMIHEWCDHIQPKIENFQDIDLSESAWWLRQLQQNQSIIPGNLEVLLRGIGENQTDSGSEPISSGIAIPIYNQFGKLWGQIGFDSIDKTPQVSPQEDCQLLQVVGDMIYRYHERLIAQKKLQASESLYSSIFNHSADAIFLIKVLPLGKFVYETVNPAYEQGTGFLLEQIIGKTPRDIFPLNSAIQIEQWYRTCVKLKETLFYEETLELPIGTRIWRTHLVPIADSQGKIVTIQGSSRDITEVRKAVDEQIRHAKSHRLLASLTIKIRQSWQIEEILQTAVREIQTTLNADRVLFLKLNSQGTAKVIYESVVEGFPNLLNQVYEDDCFVRYHQNRYDFGEIKICVNVNESQLEDCYRDFLQQAQIQSYLNLPIIIATLSQESSTDILWGLLCVQQCSYSRQWTADEIELLKQIAAQLSIALKQAQLRQQEMAQRQELARSNQDLEQFAYIVSHDLQDPLGIIASYGQLLQRHGQGQLDSKAEKYIDRMLNSVKRMRQQIEDLLQYSRIGTRKQNFQLIDCHWSLKQAIANLEINIQKHQATIEIISPLPTLMADSSQFIQLWQNLISNAIKYHRDIPPLIIISCERRGDEWLFAIQDNGIGIEPQYCDRIFQVFQRLHTQEEYPGTGIGLAICQRIVQRHGGRIWVDSLFGQGSTFYFTISLDGTSRPQSI